MRQHLSAVLLVGEAGVLKINGAVGHFHHGVLAVGEVGILAEHLADTAGAGHAHGDHDEHHGHHHQAHQDVHAVGEQAHQLAGGEGAADDQVGALPADEQDAGVDGQLHQGHHQHHAALGLHKQVVQVAGGRLELGVLKLFAHIGLHHADGGDVFLHAGVQVVVLLEHLGEDLHGAAHDEHQTHGQEQQRPHVDHGHLAVDLEGHEDGADQRDGGAEAHAQNHLVGVLDVGHVGGQTGDQTGGAEVVDVGEAEGLNVLKHTLAQVAGKAGGGLCTPDGAQRAEQQAQQRNGGHGQAHHHNVLQAAHGDALIHQGGDHQGNDHLAHHLNDHAQRGEQRGKLELPDVGG